MENTTELDYMAILKSVAKVEDDKYEYMVSADDVIEAMKLAVEEAIPIILSHVAKNTKTRRFDGAGLIDYQQAIHQQSEIVVDKFSILNQSEPLKKMLGI